MSDRKHPREGEVKPSRDERLKLALRENLKRRKAQARGRAGMTVVTPEDVAREQADWKADKS